MKIPFIEKDSKKSFLGYGFLGRSLRGPMMLPSKKDSVKTVVKEKVLKSDSPLRRMLLERSFCQNGVGKHFCTLLSEPLQAEKGPLIAILLR